MAMEHTHGMMVDHMKAIGKRTICTVKDFMHGKMAENMKETTKKIKKMDLALTLGQMDASTLANGKEVDNMAGEDT